MLGEYEQTVFTSGYDPYDESGIDPDTAWDNREW
jgi:hypothetical protein